jgi:hypothetical protein
MTRQPVRSWIESKERKVSPARNFSLSDLYQKNTAAGGIRDPAAIYKKGARSCSDIRF